MYLSLTGKKLKAAEMLANPAVQLSKTDISKELNIAYSTLWRWLQDPEFMEAVEKLVLIHANSELSNAWNCLIKRMPKDTAAIKLFFELTGRYTQQVETTIKESPFSGLTKEQLEKLADGNSG